MGSCYSRKANAEKYTYSSSQMASTKLDETSRLARPTPYTRNLSLNSTSGFSVKKGIPPPTKYEHSSPMIYNSNEANEVKVPRNNIASQLQSSIPRYTSNAPSISSEECGPSAHGSLDNNCNKSEDLELHVMNNNDIAISLSLDVSPVSRSSVLTKDFKKSENKGDKISSDSKSCPDNISSQAKLDDKNVTSRIPAKFNAHITGLPRPQLPQYVSKTSHAISHQNIDNQPVSKLHSSSHDKFHAEKKAYVDALSTDCQNDSDIMHTSHITSSGDSHDSITDIDSGLGNSLVEKNKQEDADTLKDLEHLETCDGSPVNSSVQEEQESSCNKVVNRMKDMKIEDKISLRSPIYKREANGKWIVDDRHFEIMQKYIKMANEKNTKSDSPLYGLGNKALPKLNYGEHSFSTYASYKGLVSYKRQSPFKYFETQNSLKGKFEKNGQSYYNNVSNIPVVRKPKTIDGSYSKNMFSTSSNGSDRGIHHLKLAHKSSYKMEFPTDSKQSSPESDDKSDSIGNGIGSPVSELENREFLIDDEIADQPGLISFENSKMLTSGIPSLQQTVTELHALQAVSFAKKRTDSVGSYSSRLLRDRSTTENRDSSIMGSEMGSSCSSIASDDLMLDYDKTFDNFPDGTANEGSPSFLRKQFDIEMSEDKVFPLRHERKSSNTEYEEKNKKWLHRKSSGSLYGGSSNGSPSGKMDWRLRSVSLPLRPPRQMTVREDEDGSVKLDSSSYRLLCQDLNGVKTLLFRLKTVLQEAETLNPFDQANPTNIFYHNLAHSDFPSGSVFVPEGKEGETESLNALMLTQENVDLRRQLVLLQQQLEEKDHTIHLLQQQMTKYTNLQGTDLGNTCSINAATQTDRVRSLTGSLTNSLSADNSSETLVSVQDAFEEHFSETFKEQDKFRHQVEEITQSLSNLNQNLRVTASKHLCLQNRSFSSLELSCYRNSS